MNGKVTGSSAGAFFGLLFLLSLPFWLLGAMADGALLPGLPISAFMVVCPVLAAGILCWRAGGSRSLWAFLQQATDWRKLPAWAWVVAIGAMPFVMIIAALIQIATGADLPAPQWTVSQTLMLFALFLVAGIAEELGWTGYATRRIGTSYGVVGTGLIIGIVAVVWHVVPLLQADRGADWIAWWALATLCRRILIVWLYFRGGCSVFGASLLHAMSNLSWMLFPVMGSHYDPMVTGLVTLFLAAMLLAIDRFWRRLTE